MIFEFKNRFFNGTNIALVTPVWEGKFEVHLNGGTIISVYSDKEDTDTALLRRQFIAQWAKSLNQNFVHYEH